MRTNPAPAVDLCGFRRLSRWVSPTALIWFSGLSSPGGKTPQPNQWSAPTAFRADERESRFPDDKSHQCRDDRGSKGVLGADYRGTSGVLEAQSLCLEFCRLIRERHAKGFPDWLAAASGSDVKEIQGFARGLVQDRAAVEAALSCAWSNGQVEGHRLTVSSSSSGRCTAVLPSICSKQESYTRTKRLPETEKLATTSLEMGNGTDHQIRGVTSSMFGLTRITDVQASAAG